MPEYTFRLPDGTTADNLTGSDGVDERDARGQGGSALDDRVLAAIRERGFACREFPDYLRLVRGHCEIHVAARPDHFALCIPVVKLGPDRPVTSALKDYLEERNRGHKGPGLFQIGNGFVWYEATAPRTGDVAAVALAMQQVVERLGPRVLNILG